MIFTVDNPGDVPVVLGNNCGGRWLSLERAGESLEWDRSCKCQCGSDACGCPAVCEFTQRLLVPGDSAAQAWDGVELRSGGPGCYEPVVPRASEVLNAVACWNQPASGQTKGTCQSQAFTYGESDAVTVHAKPTSFTGVSTTIDLENQSGAPIEVLAESCGVQGWFRLKVADNIVLDEFCPCGCDADRDFRPGHCPVCGGCTEPVYKTIPVGGKISYTWDGKFWFKRAGCSSRYDMPPSMELAAEACWRKPGVGPEICAPLRFKPGQTSARATAFNPTP